MATQLYEGGIRWLQDLNASTSSTVFPTASTDGVSVQSVMTGGVGPGRVGNKIYVMVDYRDTVGATSCLIGLYGYATTGVFATVPATWSFIGALNKGQPIAASGVGGFQASALRAISTEAFEIGGNAYERFKTRSLVPAGTAPTVSTYIGFPIE
jgi:hypothetical protein